MRTKGRDSRLKLEFSFEVIFKVLFFAALLSILNFCLFLMNPKLIAGTDFVGFLTGGRIIKSNLRSKIYDLDIQRDFQKDAINLRGSKTLIIPFRNPPTIALAFAPFSFLPLILGYKIFVLVNVILLIFVLGLFKRFYDFGHRFIFYTLAFTFMPSISAIVLGQISVVILIVFFLIFYFLGKGKGFWAGVSTSLLFNKPQYLLFLPFALFLSKEKINFFKGFLAGFLFFLLLSFILVGVDAFLSYPGFIFSTELPQYATNPSWVITFASFLRFLKLSNSYVLLINFLLYGIFSLFFLLNFKSKNFPYPVLFSSSLLFTIPFSIHAWEHDLMLLFFPMFWLLKMALSSKKLYLILFFVLYLVSVVKFILYPFMISFILLFVGVVLLLTWRREASSGYLGELGCDLKGSNGSQS